MVTKFQHDINKIKGKLQKSIEQNPGTKNDKN